MKYAYDPLNIIQWYLETPNMTSLTKSKGHQNEENQPSTTKI